MHRKLQCTAEANLLLVVTTATFVFSHTVSPFRLSCLLLCLPPQVEHVVHYDAARSAEVFIHRAGRTARARAAGLSLSIVAPRDDANHRQTCSVLGLHEGMKAFPLEIRLVERARERVGMALKVSGILYRS